MAIKSSGSLSFADIRNEFGGPTPASLGSYYRGGSLVPNGPAENNNIPTKGHWQEVLDYVAAIQDPIQRALAEVALNDTLTWERSSPFLNATAAGLGMTDEQLDALFIQAGGIAL